MDLESKIALSLIAFLLVISAVLLEWLANISLFSKEFISGFVPFACLVIPYISFSSAACVSALREWIDHSLLKKICFPFFILTIYTIFSALYSTFSGLLFFKLTLWLILPTMILSFGDQRPSKFYWREYLSALLLWLPIEFGYLAGFDIVFKKGIEIPALALAAPAFGLYLFAVLGGLPDIGFTFRWRIKHLLMAAIALIILGFIVIPIGTSLGFIRYSIPDTSLGEVIKLIFGIYFMVALPEELLFRGILQNLISKSLSSVDQSRVVSLLIGSAIFGLAHWNNFNPPDWRYVFLAFVAGIFYGWTYLMTGRTTVSALVHCGVNFLWAVMFKETSG